MTNSTSLRRGLAAALLVTVAVLETGCGVVIPADPDGTLQRIEETGGLRAGATPAGVALTIDGTDVSGALVELVEGFAEERGAEVEWVTASEETLVDGLETAAVAVAG